MYISDLKNRLTSRGSVKIPTNMFSSSEKAVSKTGKTRCTGVEIFSILVVETTCPFKMVNLIQGAINIRN